MVYNHISLIDIISFTIEIILLCIRCTCKLFLIYNFSTGKSHCQRDSEHWNCGSSLEITESLAFRSIFVRFLLHHNFLRFKKNCDYILLLPLASIFVRFNPIFKSTPCRITNIFNILNSFFYNFKYSIINFRG